MPSSHPDAYAVLGAPARAELRVKGSRFLVLVLTARSEADAQQQRLQLAEAHPDASHLCWALRLGHPEDALTRSSDAGEPAGSAGPPIGRAIAAAGLSDLLCVVLRWFGGTKLGVGGLIRAYGDAAKMALAIASREERLRSIAVSGSFAYELESPLRALLARLRGSLASARYGEEVNWCVALPPSAWPEFSAQSRDLARGRTLFRLCEETEAADDSAD